MKKFSMSLLAGVLAFGLVTSAFANDRENFSVNTLEVEAVITATDGSMTISNATIVSPTITSPTISGQQGAANIVASGYITEAGERVVTSSVTNDVGVLFGTTTNTAIITFSPVFVGTPLVSVFYHGTVAATATVAYATSITPTNFTVTAPGAPVIGWIAVGTK